MLADMMRMQQLMDSQVGEMQNMPGAQSQSSFQSYSSSSSSDGTSTQKVISQQSSNMNGEQNQTVQEELAECLNSICFNVTASASDQSGLVMVGANAIDALLLDMIGSG